VAEHPILFSGPMVRAILEGRKTQTRRVIRNPSRLVNLMMAGEAGEWCPYGQTGDLLWVRETWAPNEVLPIADRPSGAAIYRADERYSATWRPSIHMPRWASRLTLRLTDVRVQRLQEITGRDAVAEGIEKVPAKNVPPELAGAWSANETVFAFARLWDSINAKRGYSWDSNPFCWALTFEEAPRG
jgi:hypothetical protein